MRWPTVCLDEVATIVGGSTPLRSREEFWNGDIPWVTPTDLPMPGEEIAAVTGTTERITSEGLASCSAQLLPVGTVLFSSRATIGKLGISKVQLATNQGFANFIPKPWIDARFLGYSLQYHTPSIANLAGKTTFKEVSKGALRHYRILLPPLSEQRRIVEILDQADALRKKCAEADAKADRILHAVFIKMFGDPATNPKGWEIVKLSHLAIEFRYGTSTKCSAEAIGLPVLRIPNILRGEVDLYDLKYAELPAREVDHLLLQRGDLLFVRTNGNRDYVSRCAVFDLDAPYLFASYLIRARVQQDKVDPWYVGAYLRTSSGRQAMSSFIRTTAGQSNINLEGLRQIPIPLPPLTMQRLFRAHIEHLYWLRQELEKSGNSLDTAFSCLLHRSFSGNLTAKWRDVHIKEIMAEMDEQAKSLAPHGTHSQRKNAALQESLF